MLVSQVQVVDVSAFNFLSPNFEKYGVLCCNLHVSSTIEGILFWCCLFFCACLSVYSTIMSHSLFTSSYKLMKFKGTYDTIIRR